MPGHQSSRKLVCPGMFSERVVELRWTTGLCWPLGDLAEHASPSEHLCPTRSSQEYQGDPHRLQGAQTEPSCRDVESVIVVAVYPSEGLANLTTIPKALPRGLLPHSTVKSSCWPRSLPGVRSWPWDTVACETQTEEAHAEVTGKPHASLRRPRCCRPCGSPGLRPPTAGHTHTAAMRGRPTMLEVGSMLTVERRGVGGVRTALASASFCSSGPEEPSPILQHLELGLLWLRCFPARYTVAFLLP